MREVDQSVEVLLYGCHSDALCLEPLAGTPVVERDAHLEVRKEDFAADDRAAAALRPATHEQGMQLAVQPLERSPTMMLGRKICTGMRSAWALTSRSASNFDCSYEF